MDLDVIILNYNTEGLLKDCLESIFKHQWQRKIQITVVDNNSIDGSVAMVKKKFPNVKVIESKQNLGFSGGNNLALKSLKARYGLLLNSDTLVMENSFDNLVEFMDEGDFGVGSCKLVFPDRSFQPNGGDLPKGLPILIWITGLDDVLPFVRKVLPSFHRQFRSYYRGDRQVGWVSGSVMMIKKEVVEKIGGLDDKIFMYGEDVEYCLRASRKGIKVGWTDRATIIHIGGGSSKDPSLRQWVGEIKGLLYVYQKYYGAMSAFFLKILFYIFTFLRMVAFMLVGRSKVAKVYGEVLQSI